MNAVPAQVIETQVYQASFGLGLWDDVQGRLVCEGLAVDVARLVGGRARQPVTATANRSGIFAAHGLPALVAYEAGAPLAPVTHLVTVRDALDHYVPVALQVDLPAPGGIVLPPCGGALWPGSADASPPITAAWVPLLPAPAYPAPFGCAVVRATCVDDADGTPVRHVVLEFHHGGRFLGRAVSDARGEALALFPYPEPAAAPVFSPGSPPGPPTPAAPLAAARWALDLVARWRRDLPLHPDDRGRAPLPELCALLTQPLADAIEDASPPVAVTEVRLAHGQALVLPRLRIRTA